MVAALAQLDRDDLARHVMDGSRSAREPRDDKKNNVESWTAAGGSDKLAPEQEQRVSPSRPVTHLNHVACVTRDVTVTDT